MTIPVDSAGRFEATTADGVVFGEGVVADDGAVDFRWGDHDDGQRPHEVLAADEAVFAAVLLGLPQAQGGELRAAGG